MGRRPARPRDGHYSIEFESRNDTFGTGCQFPDSGDAGGGRGRQIWAGGQPSPEMVIIQKSLNKEIVLSGLGVNSQILVSPGGCRGGQIWARGQPGPEIVIIP